MSAWSSTIFRLLLAGVAGAASVAEAETPRELRSFWPDGKTIIPWLEVNRPGVPLADWKPGLAVRAGRGGDVENPGGGEATVLDWCVEGLHHWALVTDTAIVTTKPGKVGALYPELMRRKPANLRIIGGLKTYVLQGTSPKDRAPYDFADARGWRRITRDAVAIARITGSRTVVLECETAWQKFQQGKASIDFSRLRRSLIPLRESDVVVWWNPIRIKSATKAFPDRTKQTALLVRTLAEALPDSVFLTSYTAWHGWEKNRQGETSLRQQMADLVGDARVQERLLVTPDGLWHYASRSDRRVFTPGEAIDQIWGLPGRVVNVYTGGAGWVDVGRAFAELRRRVAREDP